MDTFYWEQEDPIPTGYSLFYSSLGNFEFAYPFAWSSYIDNGIFTAVSENQSYMQCTVREGCAPIQSVDLNTFLQTYSISSDSAVIAFDNSGDAITAQFTYLINGVEYQATYNILYFSH